MIESPKNFIEQFQNFIEHIAGVMKTFLTKEVADNYYLGKSAQSLTPEQKAQVVQNLEGTFLPLSGGSMLGSINVKAKTESNASVYCLTDGGEIQICTGGKTYEVVTKGTALTLRSKPIEGVESEGEVSFGLDAKSASGNCSFIGTSTGSLRWLGREIERINAIGENYIRYESGLQICWGRVHTESLSPTKDTPWHLTFPVPFSVVPSIVSDAAVGFRAHLAGGVEAVGPTEAFGYYKYVQDHSAESADVSVIAIGKWK